MKVFVYGSLLSGFGNHVLLDREGAEFIREDLTQPEFTMISLGGFPGVIEGGETAITGEVYEVNDIVERSLDRLEGVCHDNPEMGLYRRKTITLTSGEEALIYIYNGSPRSTTDLIGSGSWRAYCDRHDKGYRRHG